MDQELYQPQNSSSNQENKNNNQDCTIQSFKIQLTSSQAAYLSKLLPTFYSFQLQHKSIKKNPSSEKNIDKQSKIPINTKKTSKVQGKPKIKGPTINNNRIKNFNEDENENVVYQKYNVQKQISRNNSYENISEQLRPCIKILNLLKNSQTSWPFREPVDPIALGIPHYTQIIKQPMDLSTIQNNLRTNQYISPTQFHADVSRIITNSYTFNSTDAEFKRITAQFETYYRKITANPYENIQRSNSQISTHLETNKSTDKKIKKESSRDNQKSVLNTTISMNEKKELGLNIKNLPKEHMRGVLDIVNEGRVKSVGEFDLKELDNQVIRKLQNYVKDKLGGQKKNKPVYGCRQKVKQSKQREESSFQIDQQDDS